MSAVQGLSPIRWISGTRRFLGEKDYLELGRCTSMHFAPFCQMLVLL